MTTMSMKALTALSFLALAAAPAFACEDHGDAAAMSGVYGSTSAPTDPAPQAQTPHSAQNALACEDHGDAAAVSGVYGSTTAPMDPAPQAQTPHSAQNALHDAFPDIGFGKWWIGD